MKKIYLITLLTAVLLTVFSTAVAASETSYDEYVVSTREGVAVLTAYDGGTPIRLAEGSLGGLLSTVRSGARVLFDSVTIAESIILPQGEYTFSGSLSMTGNATLTVEVGTSLTLESLTLTAERGYLRIKGGSVTVCDSHIGSGGTAVMLDYSSCSSLTVESGRLVGAGDGTVDVRCGNLILLGGELVSTSGAAVRNDGVTYLSGAPTVSGIGCDILTEKAIRLSYNGNAYASLSPLSVRFSDTFRKGGSYEIFYTDSPASYSSVTLSDASGKPYALTQLGTTASVHLPYTVRYYDERGIISYEECLAGEHATPPEPENRVGYAFSGWYYDREGGAAFSPESEITDDLSVYAIYKLLPPEFIISGIDTVYDGRDRTLGFTSVTHPLDGICEYTWYKGGVEISSSPTLTLCRVSDSGEYSCRISFSYGGATATVVAEGITVRIARQTVKLPEIPSAVYCGREIAAELYDTSLYTVTPTAATNAGRYSVTLRLKDSENYRWESTETDTASAVFEILKADNLWLEELFVSDIYFGAQINIRALARFGEVHLFYSLTEDGVYTEAPPLTVGEYFVKAVVFETENYRALESAPLVFSILEDHVVSLIVTSMPERCDYRAFERLNPYGLVVTAYYAGGKTERISPERISVNYQRGDTLRFGDSGVILGFGGVSVMLPLNVSRAEYDLSSLEFGSLEIEYDAAYHTLDYSLPEIVGRDGIALRTSTVGGGTDAGEYIVSLVFSSDSVDYKIPDTITLKLIISPITREISWQNTEFVYDGKPKAPVATYVDVYGTTRTLAVFGAVTDAGEGYIATADTTLKNYLFTAATTVFSILRADYDLSGAFWSEEGFVYDGEEKNVSLLGLPDGLRVVGYTNARATSAGEYTAVATLAWDTKNYNAPAAPRHTWRIERAEYDLSGIRFDSVCVEYDGEAHFPLVSGKIPLGADGSELSYSFSTGVEHVSEGRVTVRIIFSSESANYSVPEPLTAYVEITPRPITVVWESESYVYDGSEKLPTARAAECGISVSGAMTDAGEYVAVAVSLNPDYRVENATFTFVIAKAQNAFTSPLRMENLYFGSSLAPHAAAVFGDVEYRYYLDPECTSEIASPVSVGLYYVVAVVGESRNYLELRSSPIAFRVMEILPTALSVTLFDGRYTAFYSLSENDFSCLLHNNDGSTVALDPSLVCVVYENGSSLRRKDTSVTFVWESLSATLPIEVEYAVYDMSGVIWENTEADYDGAEKRPTLTRLPEGVGVIGYSVDGGVEAGEYAVRAILSYDSENYLAPTAPETTLTVLPRTVSAPTLSSVVYDGAYHTPVTELSFFEIASAQYREAGRYAVTLTLTDTKNYRIEDVEGGECTVIFEILPRPVAVTVSNAVKYLWEDARLGGFTYDVSSIVSGDDPTFREYIEGGAVLVRCENANYTALVTPGMLEKHSYPSPELLADIFVVFFVALTLLLVGIILWLERGRISDFVAVTRCRISHGRAQRNAARSINAQKKSIATALGRELDAITTEAQTEAKKSDSANENGAEAETADGHASDESDLAASDESDLDTSDESDLDASDESNFDTLDDPDAEDDVETDRVPDHEENTDGDRTSADASECRLTELESIVTAIDTERADELISDSLAKGLVKKGREIVCTQGTEREIVNVHTLSKNFETGDRVDVNILKEKSLVPYDTAYIKVLAGGILDKALSVYANDFSLAAVKMIALTGGEAVRVVTVKDKSDANNPKKGLKK